MQVRKQQLELDMEQQTGSKLGKEYIKAVYCHPVYLTYMQSTSCEMLGWMKHKLESRLPGEISITSDMQMILPQPISPIKKIPQPSYPYPSEGRLNGNHNYRKLAKWITWTQPCITQ